MERVINPDFCKELGPLSDEDLNLDKNRATFIIKKKFRRISGRRRLGLLWMILDPIVTSFVYLFVFTVLRASAKVETIFIGITLFRLMQISLKTGMNSIDDFSGGLKAERVRTRVLKSSMIKYRIIDSFLQSFGVALILLIGYNIPLLGMIMFLLIAQIIGFLSENIGFPQLLNINTIIYSPTWKKIVTFKEVVSKFKIHPENFCLAKSLCGDPSDNINGIKGAGFKTIAKRYPQMENDKFVSIDELINLTNDNIEKGSKIKLYKNILENEDLIRRNWKLTYLDIGSLSAEHIKKIEYSISNFKSNFDKFGAIRLCLKKGIKTIDMDRLFLSFKNIGEN